MSWPLGAADAEINPLSTRQAGDDVGAEDARYVLDTFPIVRAQDERKSGGCRTLDDMLRWLALLDQVSAREIVFSGSR